MSRPEAGPVHRQQAEVALVRAAVLFRLGGLVEIGGALLTVSPRYPRLAPPLLLAGLVTVESALLVAYWLRRRRFDSGTLTADLVFCVAGLLAGSWASPRDDTHTWVFFMYPFTLLACIGIGVGFERLAAVLAATAALVTGYLVADIAMHGTPWWNAAPNVLSYLSNSSITWLVAHRLRRSGDAADAAETRALGRTAELATARESARYERMLHDRVLQTMEMLGTGGWIADGDLRRHVRSEAAWLRGIVSGEAGERATDLSTALQAIVREHELRGFHVEVNGSALQPPGTAIDGLVATAVAGAVREAVTNAAKHAGVDTAVVRAALDRTGRLLTVSVVDHGRGFDLAQARSGRGTGLARSVVARVEQLGGTVRVDTAPGCGAAIEMHVPLVGHRTG